MKENKIFLADDDAEDRSIIQDAIQSLNGGDVMIYADNGENLLDLLKEGYANSIIPCLIVLDLNMPKMNGTQTLSALKGDEILKHIPVIIYSTSINPLEKERCLSLGAHSFITKPISMKESRDTAASFLKFCQKEIPNNARK